MTPASAALKLVELGNIKRRLLLAVFLVGVTGIGWAIGTTHVPGDWYASLRKLPFNPPNWIFAPTWTVLHIMIAVAGWRTLFTTRKELRLRYGSAKCF